MKRIILISIAAALIAAVGITGYYLGRRQSPSTAAVADHGNTQRKILYWKGPMTPNFHSDKPGKSPMGMDLVPVYANEGGGDSSDVKIDPDVVNNLGVRTSKVKQGSLSNRLETVGYVGYDEDTVTSINTRADGWIEKLGIKSVGDAVHRGQMLYELFSPKLATAEREYLTALESGSASLMAASAERMQALGFTAGQVRELKRNRKVSDRVARRAESDGVVMALGVREGAYVMPATQVMKLADLSTVWVLVEVDESQAGMLRVGQQAVATFDAFPNQRWNGTVDYIYPDVSTTTRTLKVRLRFDNRDRRLQPNMFAHVRIAVAPQTDAVYIPNQALIRTGHSQRVIVALGQGRFDVCPVQAGVTSGDQVEILKGLHAGQQVVTSAQFMIDSEANVNAAALRLGGGRAGCRLPAATNTPANAGQHPKKAAPNSKPTPSGTAMKGMPMADEARHAVSKATSAAASGNKSKQP